MNDENTPKCINLLMPDLLSIGSTQLAEMRKIQDSYALKMVKKQSINEDGKTIMFIGK